MRKAWHAFALLLLLAVQSCSSPAPPTDESVSGAPTKASQGESVGTINLVNSQVETGPPGKLQFIDGIQDFHNGDNVRVTEGGKGKLELDDGTVITLFNGTKLSGIKVSTSPRRTDILLQSQGFLGHVPPGGHTTVKMPSGAKVTIRGTRFFVLFNSKTQVTTTGNFDGQVSYTPPGGTEHILPPSTTVNIPEEGELEWMEIPYTYEQFEEAADDADTPTQGFDTLVEEYEIEPMESEPEVSYP